MKSIPISGSDVRILVNCLSDVVRNSACFEDRTPASSVTRLVNTVGASAKTTQVDKTNVAMISSVVRIIFHISRSPR